MRGTDSLHTRSCWPDRCDFAGGPAIHRLVVQRGCGGTLGPCWLVNSPVSRSRVVLRPVEVRVRVLVVEMVGILGVAVFVFVVFGVAGDLVMTFAVGMGMGVLVPGVCRVVQVVVLMDRVLGLCLGHAVTPFCFPHMSTYTYVRG
jgi:hypothetical protein